MRSSRDPLPAEKNPALLDGTNTVADPDLDSNAKATPLPVPDITHVTIQNRQAPVGIGNSSGILISTFTDAKCKKNNGIKDHDLLYHIQMVHSLKSFSLSSSLSPDDGLGYSTEDTCTNGVSQFEAVDTTQGCHTLQQEIDCIVIWTLTN